MGFTAVTAIHPRQLTAIESVYKITTAEADEANAIVREDQKHQGRPFLWKGEMIDAPIVARARSLLEKYNAQK